MEHLKPFNPNDISVNLDHVFGLPFTFESAQTIWLPVPWGVTASYGDGSETGPGAIQAASQQIELCDPVFPDAWKQGIYMVPEPTHLIEKHHELRPLAVSHMTALNEGGTPSNSNLKIVNSGAQEMVDWVRESVANLAGQDKRWVLIGGDHSTPLGAYQYLDQRYQNWGLLQLDAHADLVDAYCGFTHSHASIMHNALQLPSLTQLVQVGIRDYPPLAYERADADPRITWWRDWDLKSAQFQGVNWQTQCQKIIEPLPQYVAISVDIDGLEPMNNPATGTPVPGGLTYEMAIYLLHQLKMSGRHIISADLVEVNGSQSEWDANVGARLALYLSGLLTP